MLPGALLLCEIANFYAPNEWLSHLQRRIDVGSWSVPDPVKITKVAPHVNQWWQWSAFWDLSIKSYLLRQSMGSIPASWKENTSSIHAYSTVLDSSCISDGGVCRVAMNCTVIDLLTEWIWLASFPGLGTRLLIEDGRAFVVTSFSGYYFWTPLAKSSTSCLKGLQLGQS